MAQYFEVLNQNDGSLEQSHQFFNGNPENEQAQPTQVRYILADESPQFAAQQLIVSGDRVMVLEGSQQQVVIDQGRAYPANQSQQFGAVVQNANMNNQPTQHIFYMETSNSSINETVQAVIEPVNASIQSSQPPAQPIVLNHQMGPTNSSLAGRQMLQGNPGHRPVVRTPARPGQAQVNQQPRPVGSSIRQALTQQARLQQPSMRPLPAQPVPMRVRNTVPQQLQQQNQQRSIGLSQLQSVKSQLTSFNRQMSALQQQQQTALQQQQMQQQAPQAVQQQAQQVAQQTQSQQVLQSQSSSNSLAIASQIQKSLTEYQHMRQQMKNTQEEELDDHDPAMNSTPGQMANYRKMLELRQQIGKNPILARLPSNIKVTPTSANHPQQQQNPPPGSIAQTVDLAVNQVVQQQQQQQQAVVQQTPTNPAASNQQQMVPSPQTPQKKPRAPPRPKNPNAVSRTVASAARQAAQRLQAAEQQLKGPRPGTPRPPASRFSVNPKNIRFPDQQSMMQQQQRTQLLQQQQQAQQSAQTPTSVLRPQQPLPQPPQLQHPPQPVPQQRQSILQQPPLITQQPKPAPPALQQQPIVQQPQQMTPQQQASPHPPQNGTSSAQSQMNYLITPPSQNRPRQQCPLPAYVPSSQIQQIIGMFQESTPIAEEFSDSIRMLVLLENGEQRLITFTLPKEACTIQEILEQVNVPFTPETNIQVTEANTNGINYIVTVGVVSNFEMANNEDEHEYECMDLKSYPPGANQQPFEKDAFGPKPGVLAPDPPSSQIEPPKPVTPELPKLIPGKLAVCSYCGYTGEDFNKCSRCTRKLPDNVRSVPAFAKSEAFKGKKPSNNLITSSPNPYNPSPEKSNLFHSSVADHDSNPATKLGTGSKPASPTKKKAVRTKAVENEAVVISSDEEEDTKSPVKSVSEQLLNKLGASISISPVTKEPSLIDIKKHVRKLSVEPTKCLKLSLKCRTVRIGSYRFIPGDEVILDSKCVIIKAPVVDNKSDIKTVRIDIGDVVKVLACFNKTLPVIFYYLNVGAAPIIRDMLNLKKDTGVYFDPVDEKEDSYRKITLLPDDILEEQKAIIKKLYGLTPPNSGDEIIEELTAKEANDILIKTCPKDCPTSGTGENLRQGKREDA